MKENETAENPAETEPVAETRTSAPVLKVKRKKKKKYTKSTKDLQKFAQGTAKGMKRVARAVSAGLDNYYRNQERSSRKKKDGAIVDMPKNVARATTRIFRKAAKAPEDVTRQLNSKTFRRQVKALLKVSSAFFRLK